MKLWQQKFGVMHFVYFPSFHDMVWKIIIHSLTKNLDFSRFLEMML